MWWIVMDVEVEVMMMIRWLWTSMRMMILSNSDDDDGLLLNYYDNDDDAELIDDN